MVIHGAGCALLDVLYAGADFAGPAFTAVMSRRDGDGGLRPGSLVFSEDLEAFAGRDYPRILADLTAGCGPASYTVGGPSVVSLIHAAQMLHGSGHTVRFYGALGSDEAASRMAACLERIPSLRTNLTIKTGSTARTDVLSDRRHENGQGERTFIHLPGSASLLSPEELGEDFFDARITAFGGTALLPRLHDGLTGLLRKARQRGAATVVNLVYDYRSDSGGRKWKLGARDDAYPFIDALLCDTDEALKTAGAARAEDAARWFLSRGTGAVVVTRGAKPALLASAGGLFAPLGLSELPVSQSIAAALAGGAGQGDTTGCGDNFTGGFLAALAERLGSGAQADLRETCIPAVVAGGFACFTLGGVFYERRAGEKRELLAPYLASYRAPPA